MKATQKMLDDAIKDGATVIKKPSVRVSVPENRTSTDPVPIPLKPVPDKSDEISLLRAELTQLRAELAESKKVATNRSEELTALFSALSENKPVRLKPVRDMDRESPTYLLVDYYDFIPVKYSRKLDS